MILERLSSELGLRVRRLVVFVACTRCGHTWIVTVRNGQPLPCDWKVCHVCAGVYEAPASEPAEEESQQ